MYLTTVKLDGVLINTFNNFVGCNIFIVAHFTRNDNDYGSGIYYNVKVFDSITRNMLSEEIIDCRYQPLTKSFRELVLEYATNKWTGKNGSYKFEELCSTVDFGGLY